MMTIGYAKSITAYNPPGDAIIHAEYITDLSTNGDPISISSNVAVTIQRYTDNADAQFMEGQRPVEDNEVLLTVTTNCEWNTYNPTVTLDSSSGGDDITSIDVNIQGDDPLYYDHLFLWSTSSYHVEWSTKSDSPSCTHHHNRQEKDRRHDNNKEMVVASTTMVNGRSSSFKSMFQSLSMELLQNVIGYWPTAATSTTDKNNIVTASNVCIVNVQLLLNGCSHDDDNIIISDTTPAVRYFNGVATNVERNVNVQDDCFVDNSANLNFTVSSDESLEC